MSHINDVQILRLYLTNLMHSVFVLMEIMQRNGALKEYDHYFIVPARLSIQIEMYGAK